MRRSLTRIGLGEEARLHVTPFARSSPARYVLNMAWQFVSDTPHGEFTLTVLRQSDAEARVLVSRGSEIGIAEFLLNPLHRTIVGTRNGELAASELVDLRSAVVKILMALDITVTPRGVRSKG